MDAARKYSDLAVFRRLLREARPYLPHAALLLLLRLLSTPVALLMPLPLKIAIDNVVGGQPLPAWIDGLLPPALTGSSSALLAATVLFLVLIVIVGESRGVAAMVLEARTGERLVLHFRTALFRQGQRLSLAYHDSVGTTDSTYRIQYDSMSIRTVVLGGLTPIFTSSITLGAMLFVTGSLSAPLALISLCVVPPMFGLAWISLGRLRQGWRDAKSAESSAFQVVQEVLASLRVVKAFGQENREEKRYFGQATETVRALVRITLLEGLVGLLLTLTTAVGTALVLYVGVQSVQAGQLSLGGLLLIMGYLTQIYSPLAEIARHVGNLQSGLASGERALALLDQAPDVPERPGAQPIARARGEFRFENVNFGYPDGPDVLSNVSFSVRPGTRVGIAGSTGAGKSTLLSLICRFYDPTGGQIQLDGIDLRDYRLADLRNQYGIVLQEPVLFSTTIGENIAYSSPDATFEEIVAAARAADAHEFIAALPEGYETRVGERGMRLSGGERQRISLARAFLKDAPVLILDEPTSSVDVKTEAEIMKALQRLMADRTTFMIAHRLSTLEGCEVRLHVEEGRVVVDSRKSAAISISA